MAASLRGAASERTGAVQYAAAVWAPQRLPAAADRSPPATRLAAVAAGQGRLPEGGGLPAWEVRSLSGLIRAVDRHARRFLSPRSAARHIGRAAPATGQRRRPRPLGTASSRRHGRRQSRQMSRPCRRCRTASVGRVGSWRRLSLPRSMVFAAERRTPSSAAAGAAPRTRLARASCPRGPLQRRVRRKWRCKAETTRPGQRLPRRDAGRRAEAACRSRLPRAGRTAAGPHVFGGLAIAPFLTDSYMSATGAGSPSGPPPNLLFGAIAQCRYSKPRMAPRRPSEIAAA